VTTRKRCGDGAGKDAVQAVDEATVHLAIGARQALDQDRPKIAAAVNRLAHDMRPVACP
jgi:hypothetical protein